MVALLRVSLRVCLTVVALVLAVVPQRQRVRSAQHLPPPTALTALVSFSSSLLYIMASSRVEKVWWGNPPNVLTSRTRVHIVSRNRPIHSSYGLGVPLLLNPL